MSTDTILFAEHLKAMEKTFKLDPLDLDLQQRDTKHTETKVVPDPRLQWQMVVKVIECEIEHLETLVRIRRLNSRETPLALAEFSPRYFADASRDLQRAVDWFLKLKREGL